MSINLNVERDIMREMLRYLPVMAARDGQIVVRSNRGMLVVTSNLNKGISYSYTPSGNQDIPISGAGSISELTDRIADLAVYLLDTYGGKIGHTPEDAIRSNTPIRNARRSNNKIFKDNVANGYGSYERKDIVGNAYPLGRNRRDLDGGVQGVDIPMRISRINTLDTGYSLSGGNTGDLLTSNTYDGGNEILTGGISGYRSNYGSNRLLGTTYGEYQDITYNGTRDVQNISDTTETYLTNGRDLLGGYADNMYGGNDDDVDYLDVNARMKALSNQNNALNSTILYGGNTGVLGTGNAIGESTYSSGNRPNISQIRFINATINSNVNTGGVPDTYNNAASDLGIGYGDLTARGMNNARRGSVGGNNITRNANLGSSEPSRGMQMGMGGNGQGALANNGV